MQEASQFMLRPTTWKFAATAALTLHSLIGAFPCISRAEDSPTPRTDRNGDPLPPGALARMGALRFWHGTAAWAVAYSPDGKILVSAGEETIRQHDATTGRVVRNFGN